MKQRIVKEEMVELDPALDFLPRSTEALFVQDIASQVIFAVAVMIMLMVCVHACMGACVSVCKYCCNIL